MAKIKSFDRKNADAFAKEAEAALQRMANKYGLDISTGNGRFSANTFEFKVKASVVSKDGVALTREAEMFKKFAALEGMQASDLGRKFTAQGQTFTIIGYNTRAKKMPIQAERSDGARYKFPTETVRRALKDA